MRVITAYLKANIADKRGCYFVFTKPQLSAMVVFSCVAAYLVGKSPVVSYKEKMQKRVFFSSMVYLPLCGVCCLIDRAL